MSTQALVVSVIALWLVVLVLAGVVFALARQVGVLHERIAPAGALALSDLSARAGALAPAAGGSVARGCEGARSGKSAPPTPPSNRLLPMPGTTALPRGL